MEIQKFKNYLLEKGYADSTIYSYSNAIDSISGHMTKLRGDHINLYKIYDIQRLKRIKDTYGLVGEHSEFGMKGNGTVRNAINRFVEFREGVNNHEDLQEGDSSSQEEQVYEQSNHEEIKESLGSLKREIYQINQNTSLIKTIIAIQIVIIFIQVFILFQL